MRFRDALRRRPPKPKPGDVVLGQELAHAIEADERHIAPGPSPLAELRYDESSGAEDLHRFAESPVDGAIEAFLAEVRDMSPDEVQATRAALRMDDLYTLLTFVRRSALACVSGRDAPRASDGACALMLIDQEGVDWRDLASDAELLAWAMAYTGMDHRAELLGAARGLGTALEPSVEAVAARAADALRPARRLIQTPAGPAFADTNLEPYEPTLDLVARAFAVQVVLERDVYRVRRIIVGAGLPEVWLSPRKDPVIADALGRVVAGVSLYCALDPAVLQDGGRPDALGVHGRGRRRRGRRRPRGGRSAHEVIRGARHRGGPGLLRGRGALDHGRRAAIREARGADAVRGAAPDGAGDLMDGPDYSHVDSKEKVEELVTRGELAPLYLLPAEFGGTDDVHNVVYVPPFVVELKRRTDMNVIRPLIEAGNVTRYQAAPRYEGASFVPSAIEIRGSEPGDVQATLEIWGEALED